MEPKTSLQPDEIEKISAALSDANKTFMRHYPGESNRRQAVHTVYGGAHLFKADSAQKLGAVALRSLQEYAPDLLEQFKPVMKKIYQKHDWQEYGGAPLLGVGKYCLICHGRSDSRAIKNAIRAAGVA